MLIIIFLVSSFSALVLSEPFRYDNYTLYKVYPQNEDHVQFLKDLYEETEDLDFWTAPSRAGDYVSVVAPPDMREDFEHSLTKRSIHSEVMLENIQE